MLQLQNQFNDKDTTSKERLKEVFEFKNREPAVIINDVNYWTFGEKRDDIPEDYYGNDPSVSLDYQTTKMQRHYHHFPDDCYIGFLHPWFGTGVLASGFGTAIVFNPKADPAVDISQITSVDEVRRLELPDPTRDGIMPMVINAIKYYQAHCDLTVAITDCQGPLTTALSIVGYDKFCYWVHDYPKQMHELMEKVTEALIGWVRLQKELSGVPMESESYPLGVRLPEGYGGVWLADDDAVLLGPELYKEFVVPYNSRFLQAFGGGCIHYCGTATQHIENFLNTKGLTCINCLNLDNLEEAVKMKRALARQGIPYMACDFIPSDRRIHQYYHELAEMMGDARGLVIVPYVAPAVALEKGKYDSSDRDQLTLAKKVKRILVKELKTVKKGTTWQEIPPRSRPQRASAQRVE